MERKKSHTKLKIDQLMYYRLVKFYNMRAHTRHYFIDSWVIQSKPTKILHVMNNNFLQEKFGEDIEIVDDKQKVGTKRLSQYGSEVDTDDLADDSDLDVSTCELYNLDYFSASRK